MTFPRQPLSKRRWIMGVLASIAALGALGALIAFFNMNPPTTQQQPPALAVSTNSSAAAGVKQFEEQVGRNNLAAVQAKREYPVYYGCTQYPDDTTLTQAALVPNANVVAELDFDPVRSGFALLNADPRIHVSTQLIDDGPITYQEVTFTLDAGVHYFRTFSQTLTYVGSQQMTRWQPTFYAPWQPEQNLGRFRTTLNSGNQPLKFVILATDPRTCKSGEATMPATLWPDVAANGHGLPEYFELLEGHPQG